MDVTFQKRVSLHYAKGCAARGACDRPGCQKKHHSLLHPPVETGERREGESSPTASQGSFNVLKGGEKPSEKRVCLRVVPVRVQGCGNSRIAETYALLDDGSDVSLCDLQLLEQLGLSGIERQFPLSTLNKEDHEQSGREVSLQITSLDATGSISLPRVWSVDKIPVSEGSFSVRDDVKRWSHLSDIDLPQIDRRKVMLLIGGDCPDAFWVLDERRGTGNEPYAVKFLLGWTLLGPVGPAHQTGRAHVNLVHSKDDLLQLQVERFWRSDFSDCLAESRVSMSLEDKQALEIIKETVTLVKGHYQIGLPRKRRPTLISNNRSLAESRLDQLKKRLLKNEDLRAKHNTTMNEYLSKGHAAKLTSGELLPTEGKFVWYLPHHPVFHPRKP